VCDLPLIDLAGVRHKHEVLAQPRDVVGRDSAARRMMRQGPVVLARNGVEAEARLDGAIKAMASAYLGTNPETTRRSIIAGEPNSLTGHPFAVECARSVPYTRLNRNRARSDDRLKKQIA